MRVSSITPFKMVLVSCTFCVLLSKLSRNREPPSQFSISIFQKSGKKEEWRPAWNGKWQSKQSKSLFILKFFFLFCCWISSMFSSRPRYLSQLLLPTEWQNIIKRKRFWRWGLQKMWQTETPILSWIVFTKLGLPFNVFEKMFWEMSECPCRESIWKWRLRWNEIIANEIEPGVFLYQNQREKSSSGERFFTALDGHSSRCELSQILFCFAKMFGATGWAPFVSNSFSLSPNLLLLCRNVYLYAAAAAAAAVSTIYSNPTPAFLVMKGKLALKLLSLTFSSPLI